MLPARLTAVALLLAVGGGRAGAAAAGRICFVRSEGPGTPNPQPINIWGEQEGHARKLAIVKGDAKACVPVPVGRWSLEARSARASDAKRADPNACRSAPLALDVTKGAPLTVLVSPLGGAPTNMCGWELN